MTLGVFTSVVAIIIKLTALCTPRPLVAVDSIRTLMDLPYLTGIPFVRRETSSFSLLCPRMYVRA